MTRPNPAAHEPPPDLSRHGLRWSSDSEPGITRKRRGKGFSYYGPNGKRIADPDTLDRIKSLAVPPAYTDVWICADPNGHLQTTGRDARGRKQYRYHPRWQEVQEQAKFHRLRRFAEALPALRRRVSYDLGRPGLPPEKVTAAVVRLLEESLIRVGNPEYVRNNESYGLTTLEDRHVDVNGAEIHFEFRGKGGKEWRVDVRDPRAARVVSQLQELPGQALFQWVDENGNPHSVGSTDVNAYLHEHGGDHFTAKDFRTWAATAMAFAQLQGPPPDTKKEAKAHLREAIKRVSEHLRNTMAVSRRSYVHPAVVERYEAGAMEADLKKALAQANQAPAGLRTEERVLWAFLRAAERRAVRN